MKILGVGETVLDEIIVVNNFFIEGSKTNPLVSFINLGGPIVNGLIFLSHFNHKTILVTPFAQDKEGYQLKEVLTSEKIKFQQVRQAKTKKNIVFINKKTASRTIIKGTAKTKKINHLSPSLIKKADLILLDRHQSQIFDQLMTYKKKSAEIIFDPSTEISLRTIRIMKQIKYNIIPIEALNNLDNNREKTSLNKRIQQMAQITKNCLIITAGSLGTILYDQGKISFYPALRIKPIDTLGAGDVFRGAFAQALLKGKKLSQSIEFANTAGALQCTKLGGNNAIPTPNEIRKHQLKEKKQIDWEKIIISSNRFINL